jgi:hypothetical protein
MIFKGRGEDRKKNLAGFETYHSAKNTPYCCRKRAVWRSFDSAMKSRDGSWISASSISVFQLVLPEDKLASPLSTSMNGPVRSVDTGTIESYRIKAGEKLGNGVRKRAGRKSNHTLCIVIGYHNSTIPLSRAQEMILSFCFATHVGASYLSTDVLSVAWLAATCRLNSF